MKYTFLLWLFFQMMSYNTLLAQKMDWLTFSQLEERYGEEPKPLLIFIYTDWCKYCKMQEETTFMDTALAALLKEKVYSLKLNAESVEDISFFNRKYEYKPSGSQTGQHELAKFLGSEEGKLTFPTTVILNERLEVTGRFAGYIDDIVLLNIINSIPVD